jgi:hypothetical protein
MSKSKSFLQCSLFRIAQSSNQKPKNTITKSTPTHATIAWPLPTKLALPALVAIGPVLVDVPVPVPVPVPVRLGVEVDPAIPEAVVAPDAIVSVMLLCPGIDVPVSVGFVEQSPVRDGTASIPVLMATTFWPQLAACAMWTLLLSWS